MICKLCANEADGVKPEKGECGVCGREFVTTVNVLLPFHKGRHVYEDGRVRRVKCSGSHLPAMWGHALCQGCDCHHKRKDDGLVELASSSSAAE